ncbi:hypothetical protein ILUMI_11143 [Ignelater luminosus]|uniref:Endonuclease/exonuclease/phosphatase domain-containing protein n=1 Tax=Ignelater luminosus TaxID=2038154 RepID=A0A8K0D0S4_IGNLU|nr:hypothetical protein ILUMI_11143 [Ignelater luminosus]
MQCESKLKDIQGDKNYINDDVTRREREKQKSIRKFAYEETSKGNDEEERLIETMTKNLTDKSVDGNTMTEMAKKMEWNTRKQAVNKYEVKAPNLTRKTKKIKQSKNIIKVGTWNLSGTNEVDKLKQLNEVVKKYGVDIVALQEMKHRKIRDYVILSSGSINRVDIQNQLERFWELEETEVKRKTLTKEENLCERHFIETHKRDETGRFTVSLPLKQEYTRLGDTKQVAIKRFLTLERKFSRDNNLKPTYSEFMSHYVEMGHMTKINEDHLSGNNTVYYLPHHPVEKQSSVTTKLRVVFNASQPSTSGKSLNDMLLVGPNIQDDLFAILIRFRRHTYVINADIAKMYRQINVEDSQRDLQRILWREDPNQELAHYRVNTVTYVNRFSSYSKLQRVLGYVGRFIKNLSSKESRSSGPLTNSEMNEATVLLIKMVQAVEFAEDILTLKRNGSVAQNRVYKQLATKVQVEGPGSINSPRWAIGHREGKQCAPPVLEDGANRSGLSWC